jgi:hypothetical protein
MQKTGNPDFTPSKKIARFAIRLARTPFGAPRKKFCYVHVPKCGGNSVAIAFMNLVPLMHRSTWIPVGETRRAVSLSEIGKFDEARYHDDGVESKKVYALRRQMASVSMDMGHDYVGGHFLFDPTSYQSFSDRYAWVTILREPVSRMVSHYREECRSGFVDLPLDAYLKTPMAEKHATMITRYLAGWDGTALPQGDDAKSLALSNLEKFDTIGFIDDLAPFEDRVSEISGKRFSLGHSRSGTVAAPDIDEDVLTQMRLMCQSDSEVYNRARAFFS